MNFDILVRQVHEFPALCVNEDGETVIVERGSNGSGEYVKTETAQMNGWTRINYYYKNGDQEELYSR